MSHNSEVLCDTIANGDRRSELYQIAIGKKTHAKVEAEPETGN